MLEEARQTTVCDPACGGGSFLVPALSHFREFYRHLRREMDRCKASENDPNREALERAKRQMEAPGVFALNWNIYGVDIDPKAVEICAVSLMIQVVDELRAAPHGGTVRFPSIMGENIKCGNSVLSDLPAECWRDLFVGKEKEIAELVDLRLKLKDVTDEGARANLYRKVANATAAAAAAISRRVEARHRPFNWAVEFPEVFFGAQRGFSAVIGNPPYADIADQFPPEMAQHCYKTTDSGDLYTLFVENILYLTSPTGGCGGMIVPLSLTFSRDMDSLRQVLLQSNRTWKISSYASRPSSIFDGVEQRVSIALMSSSSDVKTHIFSAPMKAWFSHERDALFQNITYSECTNLVLPMGLPRIGSRIQAEALRTLFSKGHRMNECITGGGNWAGGRLALHFSRTAGYYLSFSSKLPPVTDSSGHPTQSESIVHLKFVDMATKWASLAILNGRLMLWYWFLYDDAFHVGKHTIRSFPISPKMFELDVQKRLVDMGHAIQVEVEKCIAYNVYAGKKVGNYDIRQCRALTDEVDELIVNELSLGQEFLKDVRVFCDATVRAELVATDTGKPRTRRCLTHD